MTNGRLKGYKLPVDPANKQGTVAHGFVTPKQDKVHQVQSIPPRRVLPIIFIPGIMGSNLRMSAERQAMLKKKNNIAWRPDRLLDTAGSQSETPAERQLRLDRTTTEVDAYDPAGNPTGDPEETSDQRNSSVQYYATYSGGLKQLDGPLLQGNYRARAQKACGRGWGEVYFGSYGELLTQCEISLNGVFLEDGTMKQWLRTYVANVDPVTWQAHSTPALQVLDVESIRKIVKGVWFPVHAMGYNWLIGNGASGKTIADRARLLMDNYREQGYECEKVILVTHSMGGLVARAAIHPKIGGLDECVLGVVHGEMPAVGAAAAYRRMRCGFECGGIAAKVLGETGAHVTAVLANSQGGLELLPSRAYGNHWLHIKKDGKTHISLPQKGDPYEEIYKLRTNWVGVLCERWINPAQLGNAGFASTCNLLDEAKAFHQEIEKTYHHQSYAHYGADAKRPAWHKVVWELAGTGELDVVAGLKVVVDSGQGKLTLRGDAPKNPGGGVPQQFTATLLEPVDPGDQTVPAFSADAQLRSGVFKGIFRQTGYEHQGSYKNDAVIRATMYSLLRIAASMEWPTQ